MLYLGDHLLRYLRALSGIIKLIIIEILCLYSPSPFWDVSVFLLGWKWGTHFLLEWLPIKLRYLSCRRYPEVWGILSRSFCCRAGDWHSSIWWTNDSWRCIRSPFALASDGHICAALLTGWATSNLVVALGTIYNGLRPSSSTMQLCCVRRARLQVVHLDNLENLLLLLLIFLGPLFLFSTRIWIIYQLWYLLRMNLFGLLILLFFQAYLWRSFSKSFLKISQMAKISLSLPLAFPLVPALTPGLLASSWYLIIFLRENIILFANIFINSLVRDHFWFKLIALIRFYKGTASEKIF